MDQVDSPGEMSQALRIRGIVAIAGGTLVHVTLGTIFTFGNMLGYMASHIVNEAGEDGPSYDEVSHRAVWIWALELVAQASVVWCGGMIEQRLGPRKAALLGCAIFSTGVALSHFTCHSLGPLVVTYGLMRGVGCGLAYGPPMVCASKWFPQHKGLVAGVIVAGFGLGAFIFDPVQVLLVNPDNVELPVHAPLPRHVSSRVPNAFLSLAGIYSMLQLVGAMCLANPPWVGGPGAASPAPGGGAGEEEAGEGRGRGGSAPSEGAADLELADLALPPEDDSPARLAAAAPDPGKPDAGPQEEDLVGHEEAGGIVGGEGAGPAEGVPLLVGGQEEEDVEPRDVLKSPMFWALWCMFVVNTQVTVFIGSFWKTFGETVNGIRSDTFLATVGALASIFNAGGRICFGRLADQYDFRTAMGLLLLIMSGLLVTFAITAEDPSHTLFLVWVCGIFGCIGGNYALFPFVTMKTFGMKYYGPNYGLVFTSGIPASLGGAAVASVLLAKGDGGQSAASEGAGEGEAEEEGDGTMVTLSIGVGLMLGASLGLTIVYHRLFTHHRNKLAELSMLRIIRKPAGKGC